MFEPELLGAPARRVVIELSKKYLVIPVAAFVYSAAMKA